MQLLIHAGHNESITSHGTDPPQYFVLGTRSVQLIGIEMGMR